MPKLILTDLANLQNEVSTVGTLNANNQRIVEALEKTLSRDGTAPNPMLDELDMNSNRIINLPAAVSPTEPVRKQEFDAAVFASLGLEADDKGLIVFDGVKAFVRELSGGLGVDVLNVDGQLGNPTVILSNETRASLEKADTAVQPADLGDLATKNEIDLNLKELSHLDLSDLNLKALAHKDKAVVPADLDATGVADGTTFLSGDGTWKVPPSAGGDMAKATYDPALVGGNVFDGYPVATTAALKALDTTKFSTAYLKETGKAGTFVWTAGNFTSAVAADTKDAVFIKANAIAITSGAWVRQFDGPVDAGWFGTIGDSTLASAIATAAYTLRPLSIPFVGNGVSTFLAEVDFSPLIGNKLILNGNHTFDFSGATVLANFPHFAHIYIGGAALTATQPINLDIIQGDGMIRFLNSSHGLSEGDRFCVYNPTNGSFNGNRAPYHAGEWLRVLSVAGTDVYLTTGTYAAYVKTAIAAYKHPNKGITITGGTIKVLESNYRGTGNDFIDTAGVRVERIVDSDLSAFRPRQSLYAGIVISQCIGIYGSGYQATQINGVGGNAYGLVFANCQDCRISGEFKGARHAIALGGTDGIGAVPNRDIHTDGHYMNSDDALQGINAWNSHGNSEYCSASGLFDGGITVGGDHMKFRGVVRLRALQRGWAVNIVENLGFDFDFQGMSFYGTGDPTALWSVGAIDLCSQSTSGNNAYTTRGGRVNFNDVTFYFPNVRILFAGRNQGFSVSEDVSLSLQGAKWVSTTAVDPIVLYCDSALLFNRVALHGFDNGPNARYSFVNTPLISGWRSFGSITFTTSTSTNNSSGSVTFARVAPKAPNVVPGFPAAIVASKVCVPFTGTTTTTGFTLGIQTYDNSNFASATSVSVSYEASLDEF